HRPARADHPGPPARHRPAAAARRPATDRTHHRQRRPRPQPHRHHPLARPRAGHRHRRPPPGRAHRAGRPPPPPPAPPTPPAAGRPRPASPPPPTAPDRPGRRQRWPARRRPRRAATPHQPRPADRRRVAARRRVPLTATANAYSRRAHRSISRTAPSSSSSLTDSMRYRPDDPVRLRTISRTTVHTGVLILLLYPIASPQDFTRSRFSRSTR